jgi:hypothetical protein
LRIAVGHRRRAARGHPAGAAIAIAKGDRMRVDLVLRGGRLYFRRDGQEAEVTKVGDLRFQVAPATGATPQRFALVPGSDGASGFLHMGSRAFKRVVTKAS